MADQNYAGNRCNNVRNIVKAEGRKIVDFAGLPGFKPTYIKIAAFPGREVALARHAGHAGHMWRAAGDR